MACRGVHFALTDEQQSQLLAIVESQGDVIGFIQEDIEEQWDTEWLCETDKAWDAIHRCLTDGTLSNDNSTPFHWCVLNGSQMYVGDDYIVSFVDASSVKQVSSAIAPLSESEFRARYNAIDPNDYGMALSDEDFEYTWSYFTALRDLFSRAATSNRSVLFSVDQ
ncbi:MAG: YfbM family protein [Phycisphaera sp. RhM]|nr:YfbM family protein [Phycisphaera sp. RhM]